MAERISRIGGQGQPRRLLLLAGVVVLATIISLVVTRSSGLAFSGGSPYDAPGVVDADPSPNMVETTTSRSEPGQHR